MSTKIVTGKARFSYVNVFEPTSMDESQEKKYNLSILIPKSDKATMAKIHAAIEEATQQGLTSKFGGKKPATLKNPLRDGDIEKPEDYLVTKLAGIPAIEKLVGKKVFPDLLGKYVVKPQGAPTLVPETDGRPPLNSLEIAKKDFQEN